MTFARSAAATLAIIAGTGVGLGWTGQAAADGTETLGTPSVAIATGSGITVAGTGLFNQPASFDVDVPADATVEQVLLYLEAGHRVGDASGDQADCDITVNGQALRCVDIGGPTTFYGDVITGTHRYDITSLGLVRPGRSTITVSDLDVDEVDDGAGVVVIYRQPGRSAEISVVDGNDIAFVDFEPPRDTTAPQTFRFAPADTARTAELGLIVNSVHDPVPQAQPQHRPNALLVTVAGVTTRIDEPFDDSQGRELDSRVLPITIPAGADRVTVQMVSEWDGSGDLPASLVWLTAALAVPTQPPPSVASTAVVPTIPTTVTPTTAVAVKLDGNAALPFTGGDPVAAAALGAATLTTGLLVVQLVRRRPATANHDRR